MDKVSKVKDAPVTLEPRPFTEGEAFNLHGQVITVVSNAGGSVQFDYDNGQRRNLQTVWLEQYHQHGAFPKGTLFTRLLEGELVTAKILSVAGGEYGLDIQCENEDFYAGLETPVKFAALIKWHMQPEHEETPAAPEQFPDRLGYEADEATPDYDAGYAAGRKAALAEVMEQSEEVARLKHETADLLETIAILRDELATYKAANARLEAKGRIVNGQRYTHFTDTHILIANVNQRCRDEGLEVCHFQYDATGLKLSVVYRKPIEHEPLPAPSPTTAASVGIPTYEAGMPAPSVTIIHKDKGERAGVPPGYNQLQQSNQRVLQFMVGLKQRSADRMEAARRQFAHSPFLGGE